MRDRRSFAARVLALVLLALAAARAVAAISPESEHGAPAEAAGAGSSNRSWSFGADAYLNLVEDDSELAVDRGAFGAVGIGAVELSVYGFNRDGGDQFAVVALAVEF
jgi:hypothetical protein